MAKLSGKISYFSSARQFGFIQGPKDSSGYISRFFFLEYYVTRSEVDEIVPGLPVLFDIAVSQPAQGRLPLAISIEVLAPTPAHEVSR